MIGRALLAVAVLLAGLGLVVANGPMRLMHRSDVPPKPLPTSERPSSTRPRGGLANGVPFTYTTALSRLTPEALISDFKAKGLEAQQGATGLLPPLQALPASSGLVSAVRWSRESPEDVPMPEVLLVFGRNPATAYRLRLTAPPSEAQYRPVQDLEARLGIFRSGLDISYGIVDRDGSWMFIGTDPQRRIFSPGFTSAMESAGWQAGPNGGSMTQTAVCFKRWNEQVCLTREQDGALLVSKSLAGAMFATNPADAPLP